MTSSNIYFMKYIILTFKLAPTSVNHQISVESTQLKHIYSLHSKLLIPWRDIIRINIKLHRNNHYIIYIVYESHIGYDSLILYVWQSFFLIFHRFTNTIYLGIILIENEDEVYIIYKSLLYIFSR